MGRSQQRAWAGLGTWGGHDREHGLDLGHERSVANQEKLKREPGRLETPEGGGLTSRVRWTWTEGPQGWMREGQDGDGRTHRSAAAISHSRTPGREKIPAGACLVSRCKWVEQDKT